MMKFKLRNSNEMIDKIPIRGHFKLETFDKNGDIIDTFEDHNLVVLGARMHFMKLIGGAYDSNKIINRFVMGTQGEVELGVPKSEEDGLKPTLTDLFCGTTDSNNRGKTFEEITFNPSTDSSISSATNISDGSNDKSTVNVIIDETSTEPSITYVFNITSDAFNGSGNKHMMFNEAGMFAGDTLIAIRTFKSKAKDDSVSMKVTWSLVF